MLDQYLGRYVALTKSDLSHLASIVEMRSCNRKVKLVDIGEVEQNLNIVAKGLMRKYFLRGNEEIIKSIVREGDVLCSFISFFSGVPSRYIVETIEPTTVLSISRDNLESLFRSDPKWERMGRMMMAKMLVEKEYWLIDNIRYSSRERFLRFMKEQPELLQRVPQKYLASYLNIKPETFSRLKHLTIRKNQSQGSL